MLEQFLTLPILIFCLVIWFLVLVQRRLVEYVVQAIWKKDIKQSRFWRDLLLPIGPSGTGAILAGLISDFPFPEILGTSLTGRIFIGVVCGLLSGTAYQILKKFILDKTGNNDSAPASQ